MYVRKFENVFTKLLRPSSMMLTIVVSGLKLTRGASVSSLRRSCSVPVPSRRPSAISTTGTGNLPGPPGSNTS